VKILGGVLALLLAAGSPCRASLPDAAWSTALPLPLAGPALRPAPALPGFAAAPRVPSVKFKGVSFKGVQFSGPDRIPASLVAAIDLTEKTLLLALYDIRLPAVAAAIVRAKARGVDVRLIYDESHTKPAAPGAGSGPSAEYQSLLAAGIPTKVLDGAGSFGIMHHKYAVMDSEFLMTGSFNWTPSADEKNFENAVFKADKALIDGFTRNWHWMWSLEKGGVGAPPADPLSPVTFGGGRYPRYVFSPQGGVAAMVLDMIGRSKSTIDVAMFSFYSQPVADALIKARARGVVVRVVGDSSQARRSPAMLSLSNGGVELRLSGGRAGLGAMHHKYIIVDGALLMSGSYNFSQNAEMFNFENDLFTTAVGEVGAFGGQFAAVWAQARVPTPEDLPVPKSL